MPSSEVPNEGYRQIRVPAKVVRYWSEGGKVLAGGVAIPPTLFVGLDNGAVYQSVKVPCSTGPQDALANYTREWVLHTPPLTEEQR